MATISPFRAWRYNPDQVAVGDVVTQPYDKISPAMQEGYYAASPYNLIGVEKGRSFPDDTPRNNVYTRAAAKVEEWIAQKILIQDPAPAIYVYSQQFLVPGTHARRERTGYIALARLEDYDAKIRAIEQRLRAETIPLMYSNELYALREHIDLVRRQIVHAIAQKGEPR